MKTAAEKTALLSVEVPNRTLASALLKKWSGGSGVSLNILRGRITSESASYDLEIRGRLPNVESIVRQSAPWNAARRSPDPVLKGALS